MRRQSHYVVIRSFNSGNSYMSYPLLYTISSCFVKWLIVTDVIGYFVIGKLFKGYFRNTVLRYLLFIGSKTYRGNYLVSLPRERTQHCKSFGSVFRFTKGFTFVPHNSIRGEKHTIRRYFTCKGRSFQLGEIVGDLLSL